MTEEKQNSYQSKRKKAKEFSSREEYLEHELSIMKFRKWRINLPFRDFNIEIEANLTEEHPKYYNGCGFCCTIWINS